MIGEGNTTTWAKIPEFIGGYELRDSAYALYWRQAE